MSPAINFQPSDVFLLSLNSVRIHWCSLEHSWGLHCQWKSTWQSCLLSTACWQIIISMLMLPSS